MGSNIAEVRRATTGSQVAAINRGIIATIIILKADYASILQNIPVITVLLLGLFLTGCGGAKSTGAKLDASKALQLPIGWEALDLPTDRSVSASRAVVQNGNDAFVNVPRYAQSIEIRLQGVGSKTYAEVTNRPENGATASSFISRENIKLTDVGGPLALSNGGPPATLQVLCYSGKDGQGVIVAEAKDIKVKINANADKKGANNRAIFDLLHNDPKTTTPWPVTLESKVTSATVVADQQFPFGIVREVQIDATTKNGEKFRMPLGSFSFYEENESESPLLNAGFGLQKGRLVSTRSEGVPVDGETVNVQAVLNTRGQVIVKLGGATPFTFRPRVRVNRITAPTLTDNSVAVNPITDSYPLVVGISRQYAATVENFGSDSNAVDWLITNKDGTDITPDNALQKFISADGEFRTVVGTETLATGTYTLTAISRIAKQEFFAPLPEGKDPNILGDRQLNSTATITRSIKVTVIPASGLINFIPNPIPPIPASSPAKLQEITLTAVTKDGFNVNWSVDEPNGGDIPSSGLNAPTFAFNSTTGEGRSTAIYRAPQRGGEFTIRATSVRDSKISATIKIIVRASDATVKID